MSHKRFNMSTKRIIAKELTLFFASPMAYLFLGAFSAITLFIFFWVETFFARNIADIRPLFEWMPIILIFLASTLTMKLWSEEKRNATVEHILTQPIGIARFVIAKFIACFILLLLALGLSLPLPIIVNSIGNLDWGPVISGYLASILLGSAYISIGLFISSRSDNQIVSLISSVAICGLLYLVGHSTITNLFSSSVSDFLRLLGTGSRFDSIIRGVIDFSDLYYYLSIIGMGLVLNVYTLETSRWAKEIKSPHHREWHLATFLLVGNFLFANVWVAQLNLRADTTEGDIFSISPITQNYLKQLQEPLLIRGYFSNQTHPLLAPLVPRMKDLLREYEIAGGNKVILEIIDPAENPELEDEANNKYSIRPTPFQIRDRYQASVVNSYFDILLQYGNEFKTLGFRDLIEIKQQSEQDIRVLLRNPEMDVTSAIKKILENYQTSGNIFSGFTKKLEFRAYISEDSKMPDQLKLFKKAVQQKIDTLAKESGGILTSNFINPDQGDGSIAQQIAKDFGFKPMIASLTDTTNFYFYMMLIYENKAIQIPLGNTQPDGFEQSLRAAIKRLSSGYTKSIALYEKPVPANPQNPFQAPQSPYNGVVDSLRQNFDIQNNDLTKGTVDGTADLLVAFGANELDDKQLFAIDQYLMRGGTIIATASQFEAAFNDRTIQINKNNGKFIQWLAHHGITLQDKLILDERSAPFPVPITRQVGEFKFQEMKLLKYPYFADIRGTDLNPQSNFTQGLQRTVLTWSSPIVVDANASSSHEIIDLLKTSGKSWASDDLNVLPRMTQDGSSGFPQPADTQQHVVGISVQGKFKSWFADKKSPIVAEQSTSGDTQITGLISQSPQSARIIIYASNDFVKDNVMQLVGAANRSNFQDNILLIKNTVSAAIDGNSLNSIRARGNFNRVLPPMDSDTQKWMEYLGYIITILLLVIIAAIRQIRYKKRIKKLTEAVLA